MRIEPLSGPVAVSCNDPINFIFRGDELLIGEVGARLPDADACAALALHDDQFHAFGMFAERRCRSAWLAPNAAAPAGYQFAKLRALLSADATQPISLAGRAFQIAHWSRTHRYCGACATATEWVVGEHCAVCPACKLANYPRISPAMMVLITRGDEALLARHAVSPTNRWSALAGFVEAGESVEQTIQREVAEEVGLRVHRLRYFGSQSWPFPHSLMLAFTAEYLSGEIRVDTAEIAEARWFARGDALPEVATNISIAGHLIRSHFGGIE